MPILVFLGLSVLDLGPTYATDRQTDVVTRQTKASLNAVAYWGRGIITSKDCWIAEVIYRAYHPDTKSNNVKAVKAIDCTEYNTLNCWTHGVVDELML